jgi:hypothetical protein
MSDPRGERRNWPLDITCTLVAITIAAHGLFGIANAVDSLSRPQASITASAAIEDPLEALRHDPTTAGAFVPIAAAASTPPSTADAETEELWRSKEVLAVDTIAWYDGPTIRVHRH